jgi:putative transposase
MSRKYRFDADHHPHFVTFTVIDWIDFFIHNEYKDVFLKAIKHYQQHKGLEVYGWCIMTSHIHLILRSAAPYDLSETIKNLKSYTSQQFHVMLEKEDNNYESRKRWLLWLMKNAGKHNSNSKGFQFWQQDNQPIEIWSDEVFNQKLNYIHLNPIAAGFVSQPEDWLYSSAVDHAGRNGLLELAVL